MKAIRMQGYGHSDQLKLENISVPEPKQGQVLVRVFNAGVNPIDWKIREGLRQASNPEEFPAPIGQDFAGEVIKVGKEVHGYVPGDAVYGFATGAYAELVAASETAISRKPHTVDYSTAASIPTAGLTAWQCLIDIAKIEQGQSILIHGAGGGVGSFACQIAKWKGARVIGTAAAEDREYLRSIGVDEVINYNAEAFDDRVSNLDVVLDLVGGATQEKSFSVLKPNGFIVSTVGGLTPERLQQAGVRGLAMMMKRDSRGLAQIARLVDEGHLKPRVSCVLDIEDASKAQDLLQNGHPHGKIVLQVH